MLDLAFRDLRFERMGRMRGASDPVAALMSVLSSGASQLIMHPLEYGSMFQDRAGTMPVTESGQLVGQVLDIGPGGHHATAISDAARGVFAVVPKTGRRNLLTYTEDFSNAVWVKSRVALGATMTSPLGSLQKIIPNTDNQWHSVYSSAALSVGDIGIVSCVAKADEYKILQVLSGSGWGVTTWANFDLENGVVGNMGSGVSQATMTPLGDGFFLCTAAFNIPTNVTVVFAQYGPLTGDTDSRAPTFAGDGVSGIYVGCAQLVTGASPFPYQRVGSQYDVTEAGVPSLNYLAYNGVNTAYQTPVLPAPGVDKAQVFAGVRKLSDAAVQTLYELSPNYNSNNGAFSSAPGYSGAGSLVGAYWNVTSRGSILVSTASPPSFPAPASAVQTHLADISVDLVTLSINGTQVAQSTADQGTGNFNPSGTYPIFYGARAGTSLFFNGYHYRTLGPIVRFGTNATPEQIAAAEAYYTEGLPA